MNRLEGMLRTFAASEQEVLPAEFWKVLGDHHVELLKQHGYENFKRTLSWWYFTGLSSLWDPYARFLLKQLPISAIMKNCIRSLSAGKHKSFSWKGSFSLNFFTFMLWDYVTRTVDKRILELAEPLEGNPFPLYVGNKLISQDLANSTLEYDSIIDSCLKGAKIKRVMELGAGYGRTAYVFMKLMPQTQYWIVDIPPALYVAERYLCSQFPERKAFRFQEFQTYSEIKESLENAELAFLLPSQLRLLPDKCVDLFINISSFHEMSLEQIEYYFAVIDRIAKYFYCKQKKRNHHVLLPSANTPLVEKDYPVRKHWKQMFWKECRVQTDFFEAVFTID